LTPISFENRIRANFAFEPTAEQQKALQLLCAFLFEQDNNSLFMLKGYAGTGKSSLVGAVVRTMNELKQRAVLLAPTGRAAKVFAGYAGQNAYTIHKKIYRQKAFSNEPSGFVNAANLLTHTLFIVDEASMIANDGLDSSFGSGRLLDDLVHFVYSGEGCRLLLLGDTAQLPPVSQPESPALDAENLRGYGLHVHEITLTQVVRQAEKSGILANATMLRRTLTAGKTKTYPKIITKKYPDVQTVTGTELIERIEECYHRDGPEETIVISRSNKRANLFNDGIRNRVLWREDELSNGDLLLVVKNNYFWIDKTSEMDFIANGDILQIKRLGRSQELYGFRFRDITAYFPDYDMEMNIKILMETLHSESPALSREQNDRLFYAVLEDYADVPDKRERMRRMKADPFYNAVQVKFAYAMTCHKAQGGQWKHVFLDLSYIPEDQLGIDFYRWLYTAFTRATERIFLVNPAEQLLA